MELNKIAKYIDELIEFEKEQRELRDFLYSKQIDIINYENKAVNMLINLICEVAGISTEELEYYLYEMDAEHCYFQDGKPITFESTLHYLEWLKNVFEKGNETEYIELAKNKLVEMILEDELIINTFLTSKANLSKFNTLKEEIAKWK